ncbi:bifunctional phosphoribosylaminoimidazolecarboxamide formyltransferase/IMP cyclohydrolase [Pseudoclavibacter chungangensis]|uniref:Bifunctional purine biosynthesis protein PurH n=1 Tax=Pseudoclavibacter chungangensis TaxID=587635 RepID=A0A7J5C009_9MICO|nr:bifunctional phosphoribosylaminoimidazolecarboxamide formyltransferase/IMP cyclohydrolase [Pseudoclavibacter chungangensis]KAB1660239.1 bifunctional phosphoribosylaminoimidazolecarboxamide formyltransferase/IMP cyclohydrolase [Pseudoclavibacter chungangensis]NYJ65579.1 phosphoribosylaminoimidazolecarboxamide formyltransferase/IMP cyclohydrolase [Pseudoclavibacter chungangensis]
MSAPAARTPDHDRDRVRIRRALVSVSDKTGLVELAAALAGDGVEIVSTGSTAQTIRDAGLDVTDVSAVTGFPESLGGRVKTLHPAVHAGILADLRFDDHVAQLDELGIAPFELVVVNLYPFVETVASGAAAPDVVEQIDIGGPALVRASAKNHANVAIVVDPARYPQLIESLTAGGTVLAERRSLAAEAFAHTAAYDTAVAAWFADAERDADASGAPDPATPDLPEHLEVAFERLAQLRYGENSHQRAALYGRPEGRGIAQATQLHGKEMSYNNYVDADAAVRAAFDFDAPAVAVIKHANPCGIAIAPAGFTGGAAIAEAHRRAHATDPTSAYGGVIAANRPVSLEMAETVADIFTEVVVAPAFEPAALEVLSRKKNIRLLQLPEGYEREATELRQVSGGALLQTGDAFARSTGISTDWTLVAGEPADDDVLRDLEFAWVACRSVKSNAILLAHDGAAVGVGMGQVNRVDSCHLAVTRAGDRAAGSVAASDAFFPFADGLQVLLDAGVRAVVQPGGSVRDSEVIEAAQAAGVTMYTTGERHFAH